MQTLTPVSAEAKATPSRSAQLQPELYTIAGTVFWAVALTVALVVLNPPRLIDSFDIFSAPLHIIPEWYMLPAFGVVLAAPTKLLGLGAMSGVLLILFALPVLPKLEKYIPNGFFITRALFLLLHLGVAALGIASLSL
ncbi:hypothetical protein [Anthocerotibacter panamensis]|uniref:hypothetical protein n=1 Tax=Anthocerotibacter panamensis TaxID=2857077 RepID=UPI001C403222|nr:hypothetical protein [Anthocerotibacter panamensis]